MKKFTRRGKIVSAHLSSYEVSLLVSLCNQLTEMLVEAVAEHPASATEEVALAGEIDAEDPFEMWAKDFAAEPDAPELAEDPAIQRLFPNAYPHDASAASDFRRFTARDLRDKKLASVRVVLGDLAATRYGAYPVKIGAEEVDAWLKTLTNLRLSVATRIGITDSEAAAELTEVPDDDPRAYMYSVYEWLGFAQETLLLAL